MLSKIKEHNGRLLLFGVTLFFAFTVSAGYNESKLSNGKYRAQSEDSTLFPALVKYVSTVGLHFNRPQDFERLQIDPRQVTGTYNCCGDIQVNNLKYSPEELAKNRQILEKFNISETDVLKDQECIFSQGLPEPPDPDNPDKEKTFPFSQRCEEKGFFLTILFSQPESVAASSCTTSEESNLESRRNQCRKVLAFEFTSYSRFIFALYLTKDPQEGWKVIRKKLIHGVFS